MTPEELEELRALAGRLSGTAYNENLAAILGAALEHIDQQAAQLAEYRRPMESMDTEQLSQWNVELSTLLCMPVSDRENLWWQIAVGDHLEKFAKSWHSSRIAELEAQITHQTGVSACRIEERERLQKQIVALREIAVNFHSQNLCPLACTFEKCKHYTGCRAESIRQLSEEHPEAFR